jgi:hypothetical protein
MLLLTFSVMTIRGRVAAARIAEEIAPPPLMEEEILEVMA